MLTNSLSAFNKTGRAIIRKACRQAESETEKGLFESEGFDHGLPLERIGGLRRCSKGLFPVAIHGVGQNDELAAKFVTQRIGKLASSLGMGGFKQAGEIVEVVAGKQHDVEFFQHPVSPVFFVRHRGSQQQMGGIGHGEPLVLKVEEGWVEFFLFPVGDVEHFNAVFCGIV